MHEYSPVAVCGWVFAYDSRPPTIRFNAMPLAKGRRSFDSCPCGRVNAQGRPVGFGQCCGVYLESDSIAAPNAECLMRSRYSAFCLQRAPYLLATWHASTRPTDVTFEPGVKWLGLEVRRHTQHDATHAQVEFVARQKPSLGPAVRLHECSDFVLENGHWYYLHGVTN